MAATSKLRVRGKKIAITELELDPLNPRLIVPPKVTQEDLFTILYEEESLDELVPSFVENGFFEEEPLVVVPSKTGFVVVEGNRRLATLKLLIDENLRRRVRVSGWPKLSGEQKHRLEIVPCVVYQKRSEVIPYLGFRHITGAKKWAPFQKARFIADLLESGSELGEVQEFVGDSTQATKKLYQNYVVYRQVAQQSSFPVEKIRTRFSLLEVALGQRSIKDFLGMPAGLPKSRTERLVPEEKLAELLELVSWLFGDQNNESVIGDSRDIPNRLSKIVGSQDAVDYLRRTRDLETAYDKTGSEQDFLMKRLSVAERAIRDCLALMPTHTSDPDVRSTIKRIIELVDGMTHAAQE